MAPNKSEELRPCHKRKCIKLAVSIDKNVNPQLHPNLSIFYGEFSKIIHRINSLIPDKVLTPEVLNLWIRDSSGLSQEKEITNNVTQIELAIPDSFYRLSQADFINHLLSMTLYEYGHALIEKTLSYNSEIFRKNLRNSLNQNISYEERNRASVDLFFEKGFEEFFADTVAVLFMNNRKAVRDAMVAANESPEAAEIRNFSHKHKLEGWDYHGAYGLLSPARFYVGKKFARLKTEQEKGQFLSTVLVAILKTINQERALLLQELKPDTPYWELEVNPEKLNERFISILKSELDKYI